MQCPYCTSNISDAALVCPVCTRDLYLFKPLLEKIERLEKNSNDTPAFKALEARIVSLESELAGLHASAASIEAPPPSKARSYVASTLIAFLVPMLLLLAAHFAIVILYDLKPLYLRIASLLVPLPFGFALFVWHPRRIALSAGIAFVIAVVTVLGMSAITSATDKTPVLPQDLREAREMLEYAVSITFAFITGMLMGRLRYHRMHSKRQPSRVVVFLAQLLTTDADGQLGIQKMTVRVTKVVSALTPVGAASVSIYTGIKTFLDNQ
ncbi:MAG: hypothetical protein NT115_20095 [Proteobacteria bacterium]|nr:hypothetical protein [Pseudomonadota bacterium]